MIFEPYISVFFRTGEFGGIVHTLVYRPTEHPSPNINLVFWVDIPASPISIVTMRPVFGVVRVARRSASRIKLHEASSGSGLRLDSSAIELSRMENSLLPNVHARYGSSSAAAYCIARHGLVGFALIPNRAFDRERYQAARSSRHRSKMQFDNRAMRRERRRRRGLTPAARCLSESSRHFLIAASYSIRTGHDAFRHPRSSFARPSLSGPDSQADIRPASMPRPAIRRTTS